MDLNSLDLNSIFATDLNLVVLIVPAILLALVFFILMRELLCWYFKYNEMVMLQRQQTAQMAEIIRKLDLLAKITDTHLGETVKLSHLEHERYMREIEMNELAVQKIVQR
jgi:hypothetical protein